MSYYKNIVTHNQFGGNKMEISLLVFVIMTILLIILTFWSLGTIWILDRIWQEDLQTNTKLVVAFFWPIFEIRDLIQEHKRKKNETKTHNNAE